MPLFPHLRLMPARVRAFTDFLVERCVIEELGRPPATGIYFRTTPADWFFDWHPATRRQYVINLDAPNEITASDGEARIIGVGEIILIEDVHGKGHLSQAVGKMRRSVMASSPVLDDLSPENSVSAFNKKH
jgi:hypothetical protein